MLAARGAAAAWAALLLAALAAAPAGGEWVVADGDGRACADMSLCTPSNLTWEVPVTYDAAAGCALLVRKGLRDIHLRGDSFQRHLYVGLVLTLSGASPVSQACPGAHTPAGLVWYQAWIATCLRGAPAMGRPGSAPTKRPCLQRRGARPAGAACNATPGTSK